MAEQVNVQFPDQNFESSIKTGSENEKAYDITKLRSETGYITFDPGYANTGACKSKITFIDGETNPLFFLIQLAILSKILVVVIIYI